uniref:Sushi, nidogen and EGF-like domain-containing protein 1 n=1 Tax=Oryzias sinensis TaxID=183150 RepID=A0A8C7YEY0_9TELE
MVLLLRALLSCCCALLCLNTPPQVESAVPLEGFYPFGPEAGDSQTITQDDGGSGLQEISVAFPFFGERHTGLYVNNNGLVSFLREVSQFTPVAFPIAGDRRVVAPFWADVDNRRAGTVFYRESLDPSVLRRASSDVSTYFTELPNFNATWTLICTWHRVTFFGGNSQTPVNTFQAVLITDGELSFTIFQYNSITWTTGMHASSGGNQKGLGGIAAQAGFNAGDGKRYFNIPGSRTSDVVNVEATTNVGYPGRWVFRIDDAQVEVGGCNNSASVCPHLRPCMNSGRCIDDCITGNPSFTCSCLAGFTGQRCQIDVDECASNPCQNGGTCKDHTNSFSCECPAGYTGLQCETGTSSCSIGVCIPVGPLFAVSPKVCCKKIPQLTYEEYIDECEDRPCMNNASCTQGIGTFTCACQPGYIGVLCETGETAVPWIILQNTFSSSRPCLNGGECMDRVAGFTCTCPSTFTGAFCRCLCQNGGVCVGSTGTCECPSGFTGDLCQFEVTQILCSSRPCPDGSTCLEYGGTFVCSCQTGSNLGLCFSVQPQSVCDSSPCLNGGYCYERDGGYSCECRHGYWGKHCEKVRLNTCASGPCRNGGSCKEDVGGYRCVCPYRFTGKHCEVGRPDPCASSPCLNGGTCFHYIGKYKCECMEAFSGRHCEIGSSSSGKHGLSTGRRCLDSTICLPVFISERGCGPPPQVKHADVQFSSMTAGSVAVYVCHSGFTSIPRTATSVCGILGKWSQTPVCEELNECLSQPCLNGGSCQNNVGSFLCTCKDGFSGNRCQLDTNECLSEPCMNRGTCEDKPGSYLCHCRPGFGGQSCELEQDDCESSPCLNGGVCRAYRGSYACLCKDGFFGEQCQMLEDPCVLKPCGNRGRCWSDRKGNYNCVCKVGLTGKDCKKDLLPPNGLHVLRVEEREVELCWDELEPSLSPISMFAVTYAPLGQNSTKTDFLDHRQFTHVMQGLQPGMLYNISAVSLKFKTNSNDTSQPATALIRTRPPPVEQLQVVNVSSSQVWLSWLVQAAHHAAVNRVHVSLSQDWGTKTLVFLLVLHRSLGPGQMYAVDVLTQSGIRPDEFPSTSHSAGPLQFWTRPLAPQNLSLSRVTPNSAVITWSRPSRDIPDGFVINVTRGLNTRSRFLPNGKLGSYTIRELNPGQNYYVALSAVKNTGQEQIPSAPQHIAFTTRETILYTTRVKHLRLSFCVSCRFTELVDRRGKITAKFTHLPQKTLRHRTSKSKAHLKVCLTYFSTEEICCFSDSPQDCRRLSCHNGGTCVNGGGAFICSCTPGFKGRHCELSCQRMPHPCTRLYSEARSVPVWEGGVCHYLYKRIYKVQQDVCYREICEQIFPSKSRSKFYFFTKL